MSAGVNSVQARIDLQHKEMKRQLLKLGDLEEMIGAALASTSGNGDVKGKGVNTGTTLPSRVQSVIQVQQDLVSRLDKVLQRLMDSYSPNLSELETAWFAELGRMRREVGKPPAGLNASQGNNSGDSDADGRSLWARTELVSIFSYFVMLMASNIDVRHPQLKHQLSLLRPQLEEIAKKEKEKEKKRAGGPRRSIAAVSGIGSAQLRSVQRRLAQEYVPHGSSSSCSIN